MGDIVGLVTTAMEKFDQEETARLQAKMEKGQFTLEDFMSQMKQVNRMGPVGKIMGMMPGMSELTKQMNMKEGDVENQMGRMQATYNSMKGKERKNTDLLHGNRRGRIPGGAGAGCAGVG